MNPLFYDLGDALLTRHSQICLKFTGKPEDVSEDLKGEAIISYKELLDVIGAPESLAVSIGRYLGELAEWCQERDLPPINALAVNGKFEKPGAGYYIASGCGENWEREVRDCIAYKKYPPKISRTESRH